MGDGQSPRRVVHRAIEFANQTFRAFVSFNSRSEQKNSAFQYDFRVFFFSLRLGAKDMKSYFYEENASRKPSVGVNVPDWESQIKYQPPNLSTSDLWRFVTYLTNVSEVHVCMRLLASSLTSALLTSEIARTSHRCRYPE